MSDLHLAQSEYDLDLTNGDLTLTEKSEAVTQHLRQRLWMFLGEWFLDTTRGVAYYQTILVKNPSLANIEGVLKTQILTTPGVSELLSFDMDYDNPARKFTVDFQARVLDEVINFSEVIPGRAA